MRWCSGIVIVEPGGVDRVVVLSLLSAEPGGQMVLVMVVGDDYINDITIH